LQNVVLNNLSTLRCFLFRFVTKFALVQEFTVPAYSGSHGGRPTSQNRLEKLTFDSFETGGWKTKLVYGESLHPTSDKVPGAAHKLIKPILWYLSTSKYLIYIWFSAYALLFDQLLMILCTLWIAELCGCAESTQSPSFQSWSFKVHVLAPALAVLFISKDNGQILVFCSFL